MVRNPIIIVQARMNSERLPGKVMRKIKNIPVLKTLIDRIRSIDIPIILATSTNEENNILEKAAKLYRIDCFRGSENNVLERFYKAAKIFNGKTIIRLTADNPLIDGEIIHKAIEAFDLSKNNRTFVSSNISRTYPLGISVEVFSFKLLEEAYINAKSITEFEHVTPYMIENTPGNILVLPFYGHVNKYHYRLTIDTPEDFLLHKILFEKFNADKLTIFEIIDILDKHPDLVAINSSVQQNITKL